jgi:ABC-type transporter Mla subunit MlaD
MILGEVSSDAVSLIRNLDTTLEGANKLLNDDVFISDLKYTASNINNVTSKLNTFINDNYYQLEATINDLAIISKELRSSVIKNEPKVSKLINDIDNTIAEADNLIKNTNGAIDDLQLIAADIKHISNAVKQGDGFANKLIYDKKFASTLDSALIKIDELVKVINEYGINVNVRLGTRP